MQDIVTNKNKYFTSIIPFTIGVIIIFLCIYFGSIIFADRAASVIEAIIFIKLASLAYLLYLGGAEAISSWENLPKYVKIFNGIIALITSFALLVLFLKILLNYKSITFNEESIIGYIIKYYSTYLSISPIVLYGLLNIIILLVEPRRKNGNTALSDSISYFIIFVDIPCLLPIVTIFVIANCFVVGSDFNSQSELFISGAMAMFILVSNWLTSVVLKLTS